MALPGSPCSVRNLIQDQLCPTQDHTPHYVHGYRRRPPPSRPRRCTQSFEHRGSCHSSVPCRRHRPDPSRVGSRVRDITAGCHRGPVCPDLAPPRTRGPQRLCRRAAHHEGQRPSLAGIKSALSITLRWLSCRGQLRTPAKNNCRIYTEGPLQLLV